MSKFLNTRFHIAAGLASLPATELLTFAPAHASTDRRRQNNLKLGRELAAPHASNTAKKRR